MRHGDRLDGRRPHAGVSSAPPGAARSARHAPYSGTVTVEPARPRLSPTTLRGLTRADEFDLDEGPTFDGLDFSGMDLGTLDLAGRAIPGAFFECDLSGVRLDGARLDEVEFSGCLLDGLGASLLEAPSSRWRRGTISHSRIGAATLHGGRWEQMTVDGCRWGFVNLRGAHLEDVVFSQCVFEDLDLADAELVRVAFQDCSATSVTVRGATMSDVDLRGLDVDDVDDAGGLRGATITPLQLAALGPSLARRLGIHVDDREGRLLG